MPRRPRVGVCIVRAEVDHDGLLITVLANTSLTRTLQVVDPSPPQHFVRIDDAADAVADFLRRLGNSSAEDCS